MTTLADIKWQEGKLPPVLHTKVVPSWEVARKVVGLAKSAAKLATELAEEKQQREHDNIKAEQFERQKVALLNTPG